MLQMFHTDVVKVDRDVSYVAMVVHICLQASIFNVSSVFYIASVVI
jgi:hypothetical protein